MLTAINVFSGGPSQLEDIAEIIETDILPAMREQAGFLGTRLYSRSDGIELIQCTDWHSLDDHIKCFESAIMANIGARLVAMLDSGDVEMHVDTYEIKASA